MRWYSGEGGSLRAVALAALLVVSLVAVGTAGAFGGVDDSSVTELPGESNGQTQLSSVTAEEAPTQSVAAGDPPAGVLGGDALDDRTARPRADGHSETNETRPPIDDYVQPPDGDIGVQRYEDGADTTATVEITHTYNLTRETPGSIRLEIDYSIPDSVDSFSEYVFNDETLLSKRGFEGDGGYLEWDGNTTDARLLLEMQVNESGGTSLNEVDVGEWAFFDPRLTDYDNANVTVTAVDGTNITTETSSGFLGNHTVHRYEGTHENFTIVEPAAADSAVSPDRAFEELNRASELFTIGDRSRKDQITIFVAPDPIRAGGAAVRDEFWVHESTNFVTESTYIHEYIHTRQGAFDLNRSETESLGWMREGMAAMYGSLLNWRLGNDISLDAIRGGGRAPTVLANRSTYNGERPGYDQGRGVLIALDYRIRAATDGNKSLQDVLREMVRRETGNRASDMQAIAETVAGRSFETFFQQYIYDDQPYPRPPVANPTVYPFLNTSSIDATFTSPGVSATDRIVLSDDLARIFGPDAPGLPPLPTSDAFMYASTAIGDGGSVTVPVERYSSPGVDFRYRLHYLQKAGSDDPFPRDGIPDIVSLGTVNSLPYEGSFSPTDRPARRITVEVVDGNGTAATSADVRLWVDKSIKLRIKTNDDGEFLNRDGIRGLELGDDVTITTSVDSKPYLWNVALPDGLALDARYVVEDSLDSLDVVGTAMPRNLSVDGNNTVYLLANANDPASTRTETIYVDGEPVQNVTIQQRDTYGGWTVPVNLSFEDSGVHTVRVGDNPARTVEVGGQNTLLVDGDADGDDEFATIQAGVDNASNGDTVVVNAGTYRETVQVSKNITLEGGDGVILNGTTLSGHGITISDETPVAPTIVGLTVTGYQDAVHAGGTTGDWALKDVVLRENRRGVGASSSSGDWLIRNSLIEQNSFSGVGAGFDTSGDWQILFTTVHDNPRGVIADGATGQWTIKSSEITENDRLGISAVGTTGAWTVSNSIIAGNSGDPLFEATGIDARDSSGAGDATGNWWGDPSGPFTDSCAGAVDCSNPLSEIPDAGRGTS